MIDITHISAKQLNRMLGATVPVIEKPRRKRQPKVIIDIEKLREEAAQNGMTLTEYLGDHNDTIEYE